MRAAVATQFFYVGAQVGIWSFFVDFVKEQMPATSERNAAFLLSASLFLFMVGRFAGAWLMTRVTPARLLLGFGIAAAALTGMAALATGATAVFALTLASLFMSIMFPTIFALGIADLGEDSATGASLLIMAIIGGAVFPPLMGLVSHGRGLQLALLLPLLSFGVVMLFARMATKKDQPN